eukprot:747822-Hanusia_phi.AAC.6
MDDEEFNKIKEQAICKLGDLYAEQRRVADIQKLMIDVRPFFNNIPKAKTAKIVRTLIDVMAKIPGSEGVQLQLCLDTIEWCKQEKRTFLRHRIQTRLASMYFETRDYTKALQLVDELLREVKKLDDKPLLVEVACFVCSDFFHSVLTCAPDPSGGEQDASPTEKPSQEQGGVDLCTYSSKLDILSSFVAGTNRYPSRNSACRGKSELVASMHRQETHGAFIRTTRQHILTSTKLWRLFIHRMIPSDEVTGLIDSKYALKNGSSKELEAMRAIAVAYKERSLAKLIDTQEMYTEELKEDPVTKFHLDSLYNTLLEQNLSRLIEPFSQVQIAHVADLIKLPVETVETTLSQMILDKKFNGILDQGSGALIAYEDLPDNATLETGLETIDHMSKVVDSLYVRAARLS